MGKPFIDANLARSVIDALIWYKEKHNLYMFCYCLMPNHLHFVVQLPDYLPNLRSGGVRGTRKESILDIVGDFKSYTTSQIWWKSGQQGKLWQRSSYDHIIRYNDSVEESVSYVLNNPVRKGLVEEWPDYPFCAVVDPT